MSTVGLNPGTDITIFPTNTEGAPSGSSDRFSPVPNTQFQNMIKENKSRLITTLYYD